MPAFDTPEPISAVAEISVGDIRIEASDRADTVVEVEPGDPGKPGDVRAAEQTQVEFAGGRLLVKTPRNWKQYTFWSGGESVRVRIGLPAGSRVRVSAGVAGVMADGLLGECRVTTGAGEIQLGRVGRADLKSGAGDIMVSRVDGRCEIASGSGSVRLGHVDGGTSVKNSNGDTWVGETSGDVRVNVANGSITVDRAGGSVTAKTALGSVHLGEVARGVIEAQSGYGSIDVGIRDGVAAWLDLNTHYGEVRNSLEESDGRPEPGADTVEVRARSNFGDIDVRRSVSLSRPAGTEPS